MNILEIRTVDGPNEWSSMYNRLAVIDIKIDQCFAAGEKEQRILLNELETHFPALIDYESGGLKKSPVSGTCEAFVALLIELVAGELQLLVGVTPLFSDTYVTEQASVYRVVFSCDRGYTAVHTVKAAIDIVQVLIDRTPLEISAHLQQLVRIQRDEQIENAA
jgi:hypothetical protein